jgi:hypothetical protein
MNKKKYYTNKIMYALSKIDYAKSKLEGKEHKNQLASVYFMLLNYKKVDLKTLMNVTKLTRDEITKALNFLRELGVTDWDGKYLREDKEIRATEKPSFATFVRELERKYEEKYGKPMPDKVKEEIKEEPEDNDWVEIDYEPDLKIRVKKKRLKELLFK